MKSLFRKINSLLPFSAEFPMHYMIPLYHCVSDESLPHLQNVIPYKNARDFIADLDFISRKFTFVDWDFFKNNCTKKHPKPLALLTFDDGLYEFQEVVMPILLQKGIYAINFINPSFLANDDMMFRFKSSLIIDFIQSNAPLPLQDLSTIIQSKCNSKAELIHKVRSISYQNKYLLTLLADRIDLNFNQYLQKHKIYMDLYDLQDATSKGFGIAAHSWDHPYFYELTHIDQLSNAQKSIDFIQAHQFVDEAFAFPFTDAGVKIPFFEQLFHQNPQLKFTFGISGIKTDLYPHNLHRVPMENHFLAQQELHFETNYYRLKQLLHKNTVLR